MDEFLFKLMQQFCSHVCKMLVSACPIVPKIQVVNARMPSIDRQYFWCAKCNGRSHHEPNREKKNANDRELIEVVSGGLIIVGGSQHKTRNCEFTMACDCVAGNYQHEHKRIIKYQFTEETRDWCFRKWSQVRLERKQNRIDELSAYPLGDAKDLKLDSSLPKKDDERRLS